MDYEEARLVARRHVDGLHPLPKGFARRYTEGRRVRGGWYFDYGVEKVPPNRGGPGSGIGGAPGFFIGEDGKVTVVGWGRLRAVLEGAEEGPESPG